MLRDEHGQGFGTILFIILILIVVAIGIIVWWESRPQEKISIEDTSFGKGELSPEQSTTLTVKIKNMSDESRASNVSVAIAPLNASVVQVVGESQKDIGTLGPGKERSPEFSISIAQDVIKGTYGITVIVSVDPPLEGDEEEATIRVK